MNRKNIGELLLEYGMISEEDIEKALELQKSKGIKLGEALIELGKVTQYDIEYILSVQLGIPYLLIDDLSIDEELVRKFSPDFLIENRILPIYETDKEISIVTDDPFNEEAFEKIKNFTNKEVNLSCGDSSKILSMLNSLLYKFKGNNLEVEIKKVLDEIRGSNFFRLDFYIFKNSFKIAVFDNKKVEIKKIIESNIGTDDIFNSFTKLNIPFYYDSFENENSTILFIFPAINEDEFSYPLKVNKFGLIKINSVHFADLKSYNIENAFYSENIVNGYPYFSLKKEIDYELSICIAQKES